MLDFIEKKKIHTIVLSFMKLEGMQLLVMMIIVLVMTIMGMDLLMMIMDRVMDHLTDITNFSYEYLPKDTF
jgi:hypothetical protein